MGLDGNPPPRSATRSGSYSSGNAGCREKSGRFQLAFFPLCSGVGCVGFLLVVEVLCGFNKIVPEKKLAARQVRGDEVNVSRREHGAIEDGEALVEGSTEELWGQRKKEFVGEIL